MSHKMKWLRLAGACTSLWLAACEITPQGDTEVPPVNHSLRMADGAFGYSLERPKGWTGQWIGKDPVRMTLAKDSFDLFQPNANVVAGLYDGNATLESLLEGMAEAKRNLYAGDFILVDKQIVLLAGQAAGKLEYGFKNQGMDLQGRQFAILHSGHLLIMTFMDRRERFQSNVEGFEAILQSLLLF